MTKKEIEKLRKLFKESCISAWTSERFQIPAITKTEAEFRWLENQSYLHRQFMNS